MSRHDKRYRSEAMSPPHWKFDDMESRLDCVQYTKLGKRESDNED